MNEGALKTKWRRHARKQGFETRALSPQGNPGLPDIIMLDKATSEIIRTYSRTKVHLIEAKIFHDRPDCFKASRDASPKQVEWIFTWAALGVPTWWLILDQSKWMIIPGAQLELTRATFKKSAKKYGAPLSSVRNLHEGEHNRHVLAEAMDKRLDAHRVMVAEMFNGPTG